KTRFRSCRDHDGDLVIGVTIRGRRRQKRTNTAATLLASHPLVFHGGCFGVSGTPPVSEQVLDSKPLELGRSIGTRTRRRTSRRLHTVCVTLTELAETVTCKRLLSHKARVPIRP